MVSYQRVGSALSKYKSMTCFPEAEGYCYLGEMGGLVNIPEFRGDCSVRDVDGETLRGLLRSPLVSFHSSSSFSIDSRLFTLDSF